jgi:hypothetical protein
MQNSRTTVINWTLFYEDGKTRLKSRYTFCHLFEIFDLHFHYYTYRTDRI